MATRSSARRGSEEEASIPAMQPPAHSIGGHGGLDAGFVWQQLSEIQKSLGSLQATMTQHSAAIDKVEANLGARVDKLDDKLSGKISKVESDVSEFKQIRHTAKVVAWIVGVAAAGVLAIAGVIAKEVWTVVKPHAISSMTGAPTAAAPVMPPVKKSP